MPKQKPRMSEQVVGTPRAFLDALVERFGPIAWDLAATRENKVAPLWLGPGSNAGEDSLAVDWALLHGPSNHVKFLNPPFGNIRPFVAKAAEMAPAVRGTIAVLVPASVSTTWFAEHVHRRALVLAIRPRLTFVGQKDPFPKDLALLVFGRWIVPGFDTWKWNGGDECPF